MISLRNIGNINGLTLILTITGQYDAKYITTIPTNPKEGKFSRQSLSQLVLRALCDDSDDVCLDLHKCRYYICITLFDVSRSFVFSEEKSTYLHIYSLTYDWSLKQTKNKNTVDVIFYLYEILCNVWSAIHFSLCGINIKYTQLFICFIL